MRSAAFSPAASGTGWAASTTSMRFGRRAMAVAGDDQPFERPVPMPLRPRRPSTRRPCRRRRRSCAPSAARAGTARAAWPARRRRSRRETGRSERRAVRPCSADDPPGRTAKLAIVSGAVAPYHSRRRQAGSSLELPRRFRRRRQDEHTRQPVANRVPDANAGGNSPFWLDRTMFRQRSCRSWGHRENLVLLAVRSNKARRWLGDFGRKRRSAPPSSQILLISKPCG